MQKGRQKELINPHRASVILDDCDLEIIRLAMRHERRDRSPIVRMIIREWAEMKNLTPTEQRQPQI